MPSNPIDLIPFLEGSQALLMLEESVPDDTVLVAVLSELAIVEDEVSFSFREVDRVSRPSLKRNRENLRIHRYQFTRTHWAVRQGLVPSWLFALSERTRDCQQHTELHEIAIQGEGQKIEFKETYLKNIKKNGAVVSIPDDILKTICGFLNAEGGTVLCGVGDKGKLVGLSWQAQQCKSRDSFMCRVIDDISSKISPNPVELVIPKIVEVDEISILRIDVRANQSVNTVFVRDGKKQIYVRQGPTTRLLEGDDLLHWATRRTNK